MRKLVLLVSMVSVAVACGGGGGGGSGGGSGLTGTVGGKAFTPLEVKAIQAGSGTTPCTVPLGGATASVGLKAIALQITSYANACGDFASSTCQFHMNAQSVTLLVAKVNPLGAEPALSAGTYALNTSPTTAIPDGSGMLNVGYAVALGTDPMCRGTQSVPASGSVRLDSVNDPVKGHVSVTFQDGSKLEGDFSAPVCAGVSPDVCQLAASGAICTGAACMP